MHKSHSPFGPIALTFSGGGYRAAAYHLGTLAYLQHLDLLEDVEVLSTVSGGTIIGAAFVLAYRNESTTFEDFFHDFYQKLANTNLVAAAIKKMGKKVAEESGNFSELIMALAEIFDQEIYQGARFGELWEGKASHFREIVFNATEFKRGTSFRFIKSDIRDVYIGSADYRIDLESAKQIRIADIVAASSCFPGMFEPINFPNCFQWPNNEVPEKLKLAFPNPIPLMDGGIYDNQGIESVIYAIETEQLARQSPDYPGLIIISDTDQPNDNIYKPPKLKKFKRAISIRQLQYLTYALGAFSAVSSIFLLIEFIRKIIAHEMHLPRDVFSLIGQLFLWPFPIILTAFVPIAIYWLDKKMRHVQKMIQKQVPQLNPEDWKSFNRLSADHLIHLIYVRVDSVLAMANEIFLRQVRRLLYKDLYGDQVFKNKRISNLIYDTYIHSNVVEWLNADTKLQNITKAATNMPTTLWFNNQQELDNLIIAGNATICRNIIERIIKTYGKHPSNYPLGIATIYKQAKKDWHQFNEDPNWFLRKMKLKQMTREHHDH